MILLALDMQIVYKHSINITKQLKERKKERKITRCNSSSSFVFSHPPSSLSLSLSLPFFFSFLTSKHIQFVERAKCSFSG